MEEQKKNHKNEQETMGTKKEQRITYVFYRDWSEIIETMPAEMELQVRRAIDAYAFNNEVVELPLAAKYFFEAIKKDIDRDKEKFEDKKAKRAEAGKMGNIKRWSGHQKSQTSQKSQMREDVANVANVAENENENENGLQGLNPMCNKKTSLSKESEVKKEPQSGNALAPSLEEVKDYILSHGLDVDAEYFYSVNEAKGWVTNGGAPIVDWKSQVRAWTRNGIGNKSKGSYGPSAAPQAQRTKQTGQGYSSKGIEETKKMLDRIAKEEQKAISHKEWLAQQNNGTK